MLTENYIAKAARVRELQKLKSKRGYLTVDEKEELRKMEQSRDHMLDRIIEKVKKHHEQPGLF